MGKTDDNLKEAFAGESQANRRYLFFADKADEEGYKRIAKLFRAAADAETVHARNHFRVLDGVKSTADNLAAAVAGEHYEFTAMYPGFIKQAGAEDNSKASRSFDLANQVEEIHHGLFRTALSALGTGKPQADEPFFVCQVCGNTIESEAPDRCPVCGTPKARFKRID
jgi:rubrerythrin